MFLFLGKGLPLPLVSLLSFVFCLCWFSLGCSKEKLDELTASVKEKTAEIATSAETMAEQAKSATNTAVATVQEKLPSRGSIRLQTQPSIETAHANAEMIRFPDGRPTVLQVVSYNPELTDNYPRVLFWGLTTVNSAAELAGQSVSCDLYVQSTATDPMLMSTPANPVEVRFETFNSEEGTIQAQIASAPLLRSDNQSVPLTGGEMTAVFRGEGQ